MWLFLPTNSGIRTLVLALMAVGPALVPEWPFRRFGLARATARIMEFGRLMSSGALLRKEIR